LKNLGNKEDVDITNVSPRESNLCFIVTFDYVIKKIKKRVRLKLNETHQLLGYADDDQLLAYADDVNVLGDNVDIKKKTRETGEVK
jgi:hypothetical protein